MLVWWEQLHSREEYLTGHRSTDTVILRRLTDPRNSRGIQDGCDLDAASVFTSFVFAASVLGLGFDRRSMAATGTSDCASFADRMGDGVVGGTYSGIVGNGTDTILVGSPPGRMP